MNESKAEGVFNEAKGKVKQAFGEAVGDRSMANSGAADEVKGHAQQTWGSVKDTAHDLGHSDSAQAERERTGEAGHNLRTSVTDGAEKVKDSIERGLNHLKQRADE